MAIKLYEVDPEGTVQFKIGHRAWGVDVPAYVYDLWMPLIGVTAVGVYAVYSRLGYERKIWGQGIRELAAAMRIGPNTLQAINETLAECGFIEIEIPQGHQRKMHYTTRITLLQPPDKIEPALVEQYVKGEDPANYKTLVPWLTEEDESNHYPVITEQSNHQLVITNRVQSLDSDAKNDPLKGLNESSKTLGPKFPNGNLDAEVEPESEKPAPMQKNLNPSQHRGIENTCQVNTSQETRTGEDHDDRQIVGCRGMSLFVGDKGLSIFVGRCAA